MASHQDPQPQPATMLFPPGMPAPARFLPDFFTVRSSEVTEWSEKTEANNKRRIKFLLDTSWSSIPHIPAIVQYLCTLVSAITGVLIDFSAFDTSIHTLHTDMDADDVKLYVKADLAEDLTDLTELDSANKTGALDCIAAFAGHFANLSIVLSDLENNAGALRHVSEVVDKITDAMSANQTFLLVHIGVTSDEWKKAEKEINLQLRTLHGPAHGQFQYVNIENPTPANIKNLLSKPVEHISKFMYNKKVTDYTGYASRIASVDQVLADITNRDAFYSNYAPNVYSYLENKALVDKSRAETAQTFAKIEMEFMKMRITDVPTPAAAPELQNHLNVYHVSLPPMPPMSQKQPAPLDTLPSYVSSTAPGPAAFRIRGIKERNHKESAITRLLKPFAGKHDPSVLPDDDKAWQMLVRFPDADKMKEAERAFTAGPDAMWFKAHFGEKAYISLK